MAETSNSGRDKMLVAYMEKIDKLNDLILKLLQKINGQESSQPEGSGGEHDNDSGKKRVPNSPRHDGGSNDQSQGEFVTKEELMGLLNDKTPKGMTKWSNFLTTIPSRNLVQTIS